MPKHLKLDNDGKLAVSEKSVESTIEAFLLAEGWQYIHTKAENVKRSGAPAHAKYTLDALAILPAESVGWVRGFYLELKKRKATTAKARLKGQTDTARYLRAKGFIVYQAGENDPDPIGSFRAWYKENWRRGL